MKRNQIEKSRKKYMKTNNINEISTTHMFDYKLNSYAGYDLAVVWKVRMSEIKIRWCLTYE